MSSLLSFVGFTFIIIYNTDELKGCAEGGARAGLS